LKLEDGTPKASIFYVAYTKDDVSDASQRPLTFSFNGGPGSASVWLHLGLLGPRRVQMGDAGRAPSAALQSWWTTMCRSSTSAISSLSTPVSNGLQPRRSRRGAQAIPRY